MTMAVFWYTLGTLGLVVGILMVILSLRNLIYEKRQRHVIAVEHDQEELFNDTKRYAYLRSLFEGIFVASGSVVVALFMNHYPFASFFLPGIWFFRAGLILVFALQKKIHHQGILSSDIGVDRYGAIQFQQEIAKVLLLVGAGVLTLSMGLITAHKITLEQSSQVAWIWESLLIVGGIYWMITNILKKWKK